MDIYYELSSLTRGDQLLADSFRVASDQSGRLRAAGLKIRDAMPLASSIDNYIDAHQDDPEIELVGKLAIARTILSAESNSSLFVKRSTGEELVDFAPLNNVWLQLFFRGLVSQRPKTKLDGFFDSVAMVVFNYDRCIEQYLISALRKYYLIDVAEAAELVKTLKILRPYGSVGTLPLLGGESSADFGADPSPQKLVQLAKSLKTFSESNADSDGDGESDAEEIRALIAQADRLVFLGFAFHPINMKLLLPGSKGHSMAAERKVYGTAYLVSDSERAINQELLSTSLGTPRTSVTLANMQCAQLMSDFGRSMTT